MQSWEYLKVYFIDKFMYKWARKRDRTEGGGGGRTRTNHTRLQIWTETLHFLHIYKSLFFILYRTNTIMGIEHPHEL